MNGAKIARASKTAVKGAAIGFASFGVSGAAWIAYSALFVNHKRRLRPALNAEVECMDSFSGGLAYYADQRGQGVPLLLLHSVNAAASAYEMRPLFEHYRGRRPVYALDLPGFGKSERSKREYTPEVYARAILDFVEMKAANRPVDVVALSLSSEFAARAAVARPELFRSLAMISPSGFTPGGEHAGPEAARAAWHGALGFPVWSQAFYDLLTTRLSIRYYLGKSFVGPVDTGLADYAYDTSHQPGARFAPLAFVSGRLFTPGVFERYYENLRLPTLALYDRDPYVSFERLEELAGRNRNWQTLRIPGTRGLPHFEKIEDTAAALDAFWESVPQDQVITRVEANALAPEPLQQSQ